MSYVSPSSSSEGSTRRFDLYIVYRPDPATNSARTPRLYQPSAVTHLFYTYVRKATNTEFNVVVLGRDLILYWLSADIADVIVADHNFFQSAMLTSSLLIPDFSSHRRLIHLRLHNS
ncbi:hypothetical protein F511_43260 [Dorcoceras hygrometricum]|uniref:Uncharacterized protein n=1 Tax=Dorcoceras hygrometricum TaxID=472368 RepID=A0A2Z7C0M2_9LAMI|nr:hypothetical protein F511_43260 [Dorcoceras hygrometricum]